MTDKCEEFFSKIAQIDSVTGDPLPQLSSLQGAHVHLASSGGIGPNQDRQATAIGTTTADFTWTAGYGPKSIRARLKKGTSNDTVKIVFDAPSDPVRDSDLVTDGGSGSPRMYRVLHNVDTADANSVGDAGWTTFTFTHPLEKLSYKGVGTLGAGTVLEVEAN